MTQAERVAYMRRGLAVIEAGGPAVTEGAKAAAAAFRKVEHAFQRRGEDAFALLTGDPIRDAVRLDMARAELAGGTWTLERILGAVQIVADLGQAAAKVAGAIALL